MREELGCRARVEGLSWTETLALGVLSRRPLGLDSARALARAAEVSPTTAGACLEHLLRLGYVERAESVVVEGRARTVRLWKVSYGSVPWQRIAPAIAKVGLPSPALGLRDRTLPKRLFHLFWSVPRPAQLDLDLDSQAAFVAHRILTTHDPQALAWAADHLPPRALRRAASFRGVDARSAALAENLARQARTSGQLRAS